MSKVKAQVTPLNEEQLDAAIHTARLNLEGLRSAIKERDDMKTCQDFYEWISVIYPDLKYPDSLPTNSHDFAKVIKRLAKENPEVREDENYPLFKQLISSHRDR